MTVQIIQGDCREVLRTLPEESVHCVVTSPPYWGLRDYGVEGQLGQERTLGEHLAVMVDVFTEVRRVLRSDGTMWINYGDCYATSPNGRSAADAKAVGNDDRTFRDKPFSTIGPIYEAVSSSGGFRGNNRHNSNATPSGRIVAGGYLKPKDLCMLANRLAIALQDDGWWVRSEIIWHKPNAMPESIDDRPTVAHEKVWLLSKSKSYFFDAEAIAEPTSPHTHARVARGAKPSAPGKQAGHGRRHAGFNERYFGEPGVTPKSAGEDSLIKAKGSFHATTGEILATRNARTVWTIPTQPFPEAHFATFPPALVEPCIKAGCPKGGVVLDPFGGSGTTGLVADRLGRDAILIELNPADCEMARNRVRDDAPLFAEVVE